MQLFVDCVLGALDVVACMKAGQAGTRDGEAGDLRGTLRLAKQVTDIWDILKPCCHVNSIWGPKVCSRFGGMAYSPAATAVFDEWKTNEVLCHRAAKMCLAMIGKRENVDRREVNENYHLLGPVVEHMGFLAYFNSTRNSNHCSLFSILVNFIIST